MKITIIYELDGIEREELWDTVGGQTDAEITRGFLITFASFVRGSVIIKEIRR